MGLFGVKRKKEKENKEEFYFVESNDECETYRDKQGNFYHVYNDGHMEKISRN